MNFHFAKELVKWQPNKTIVPLKGYATQQVAAKLRWLADCPGSGKAFRIQIFEERFTISPQSVFNIEHEREGNSEEVAVQFKWVAECRRFW